MTNDDRVDNREVLIALLEPILKEKTTDEWIKSFEGTGLPYASVNNMVNYICKSSTLSYSTGTGIPPSASYCA